MLKFLILSLFVPTILSSPSGAPAQSCTDMTPSHGQFQPQQTEIPVKFEVPQWIITGQTVQFKIISTAGQGFRGFQVQARRQDNEQLIGTFSPSNTVNVINCNGISNSAATHVDNSLKTEIVITWEPPMTRDIILFNFVVTIVEQFNVFWVRERTTLLSIIPNELIPTSEPTEEPETTPAEEDTTSNEQETTPTENESIYDGCGTTKVCFGYPSNCYRRRDCELIGAVTYETQNFLFELLSMENHNYVAMGLSSTNGMGNASVIECVRQFDIAAFTSWTVDRLRAERLDIDPNIIDFVEGSVINGKIYCKVRRIPLSTVRGHEFDLVNTEYYLLLAGGPLVTADSVSRHNRQAISRNPVLLTNPQNVGVSTTVAPMILIHGSFMMVAWIGLTSIGIVMARYFKKSWPNMKIGKHQVWFIWHVICMILTWSLTIAGFVIIFVHTGEWRTTAHGIMGCIVLGFAILQPFGAIFRPSPDATARPLFNWLHKAFGTLTHGLAIITIFFAVGFPSARLPHYTLYILAAFVAFYLLMHIIFTTIQIHGEMKGTVTLRKQKNQTMPNQILLKTLLGFFIISIAAVLIALLLVFNLDFDE